MTGKQNAVMWLGLILVVTRLFTTKQWSQLWGTFGTSSGGSDVIPLGLPSPIAPAVLALVPLLALLVPNVPHSCDHCFVVNSRVTTRIKPSHITAFCLPVIRHYHPQLAN